MANNSQSAPAIIDLLVDTKFPQLLNIDFIPYGIFIADAQMLITSVNEAFCLMTGFSQSEILGRSYSFVQSEGTDDETRNAIDLACKRGRMFNGEIRNYKKNGEQFWNELTIQPIRNLTGEITGFVGISRDITERKKTESDCADELSILKKHSLGLPGMTYQFRIRPDGSSSFPIIGEASQVIYGLSPNELKANPSLMFDNVHSEDKQRLRDSLRESQEKLTAWNQDYRVILPDQTARWVHMHSQPECESDGSTLWNGYVIDITERKSLQNEIQQLAFYDKLTGLANRTLFYDRFNQAMIVNSRSGYFGAIIFIDLDQFKPVNDEYGHAVGDALLVEAATRLKHCVRASDTVVRFGGDEFVVMLNQLSAVNSTSREQASQVAEKLLAVLGEKYSLTIKHDGGQNEIIQLACTASIGVSIFQGNQLEPDEIVKSADKAMYRAKKQGGGLVRMPEERRPS